MKLYRVTLRGLTPSTGVDYQVSYAVADDSALAYRLVRDWLDTKDYRFRSEREMKSVELLADEDEYTDAKTRLFIQKTAKRSAP